MYIILEEFIMSRGQRKTIDDQIAVLDEQIAKVQSKMDALLEQRKGLEQKKREDALGQLYDMIQERGKTIDDIMSIITTENININDL